MKIFTWITTSISNKRLVVPLAERRPANPLSGLSDEAKLALGEVPEVAQIVPQCSAQADANRELERFYEIAPEKAESIRELFAQISRVNEQTERIKRLSQLSDGIRSFATLCETRALDPARQLAMAVEALLRQASARADYLSPSVLRTAASAILQLEKFAKEKPRPNWNFEVPARFMVVDDDPISRHAVCAALKKNFPPPDVAESGAKALALGAEKAYDLIFLDVEMPGMDGYESCFRIHEFPANQKTPVVFVTSHSDFESRQRSTESGGYDLIAKPFLPGEVTVKALTLLTRAGGARGEYRKPKAPAVAASPATSTGAVKQTNHKLVLKESTTAASAS